jgi:hypothetical protein
MDLLTDALTAEVDASERIGGWLGKAAALSPHILLVQAVVTIAMPRLVRHGVIPAGRALPPALERKVAEMAAEGADPDQIMREIRDYAENAANGSRAQTPVPMAAG